MTTPADPTAGGSYSRDPTTGDLTLVERTQQPAQAEAPPQPTPQPE